MTEQAIERVNQDDRDLAENQDAKPPIDVSGQGDPPADEDAEARELRELSARIEQEEAARATAEPEGKDAPKTEPEKPDRTEPPKADAKAAPEDGKDKPAEPMIPKSRFDQVLIEAQKWRDQTAILTGRLQVLEKQGQQPDGKPAEPQKTPDEIVADLQQQQRELAAQFDNGEIGMAEYEEKRQQADNEIWKIRQEAARPQTPANQTSEPARRTDLYYEQQLDQVEQEFPYVKLIASDADWAFLGEKARQQLEEQGMTLDPDNPAHDLAWRRQMGILSDTYGPLMTGKSPEEVKGTSQQPAGQPPAAPQPSATAKAREEKLALADSLPPDVSDMGSGNQTDVWTEDRASRLSEEEFEALPQATRDMLNRRFGDAHP